MSHLYGKFVWFEHQSDNPGAARAFYEGLLGWKVEDLAMDAESYAMIRNGADGIGGVRTAPPGAPNTWLSYLSIADVDASTRAAQDAGARILMAPTDFGSVGRAAAIADPGGAPFCLWRGAEGDPPDVDKPQAGSFLWNECYAPDEKKALAFYEKVFGFEHDAMDMGPQGTYYVLKKNGTARAGLMKSPPGMAATWLPYVKVADCDATATRAKSLGAMELMPPLDVPDVGRLVIVTDPTAALIAFIQPKP
jgi:predicted enzyme related to lactoylglutathione lyase